MYSSSNMLRARKKDASFKPNRILDKKSSRGMLYENEELRLRTIHINDEVERGHHDIKKLKKENDHLKREIWYLRDEYEKMEQKFNKVISNQDRLTAEYFGEGEGDASAQDQGQGFAYDENGSYIVSMDDGSPPDHGAGTSQQIPINYQRGSRSLSRKISTATTTGSVNSMYSSEDEEMNFMLMIDDEASRSASASGNSFVGMQMQQQPRASTSTSPMAIIQEQQQQPGPASDEYSLQFVQAEVESLSYNPANEDGGGNGAIPYADDAGYQTQPYHHFWHHMTSIPPELEDVKEESESTNNNTSPASLGPKINGGGSVVSSPSPVAENEAMQQISSPSPNPIIEITPATTPTQTSLNASRETVLEKEKTVQEVEGKSPIQDLGCFTLITEKFQATSHVKLSSEADAAAEDAEDTTNSQPDSKDSSSQEIHAHARTKSANARCSTAVGARRRGNALGRVRRNSAHCRRGSAQSTQSQTLSFPTHGSGRLMSQSPFPFFYQSEPSLASGSLPNFPNRSGFQGQDDGSCSCSCRKYFDSSGRMNYQHRSSLGWGAGDKHVVIGYVEGNEGNGSLGVKEIIDQLETQFDPKLENVASVRVMTANSAPAPPSTRIFIVLKNASALKLLLEKGLSLSSPSSAPTQEANKIPIRLVDAASESCTVVLAGLPPAPESLLLDTAIVSILNQYGQVVGPLERRLYKGIDISECQIQMHLVRSLPPVLSVQGYEIQVKICYKQGQAVHQPLSRAGAPPSPAPSRNASPQQTPLPQAKGGHSVVQRSVSMSSATPMSMSHSLSNGGLAPAQSAASKNRKIGICQDVLEEDLIQQLAKGGPQQMHGHSGSAMNLNSGQQQQQQQTNYTKKPLTRLPVSSPGNLAPEHQQYATISGIPTPAPGQGQATLTSKPFYRSMSFDPRRSSNASRQGQESGGGGSGLASGMGRLSVNDGPMAEGGGPGTPAMARRAYAYQNQMSTNSQMSQLERNGNGKLMPKNSTATTATASDAHKPLPWCGCWGNGCL